MFFGLIGTIALLVLSTSISLIYFETNSNSDDKSCRKNGFIQTMLIWLGTVNLVIRLILSDNAMIILIAVQLTGCMILFYNINWKDNNQFYDKYLSQMWSIFSTILLWNCFCQCLSFIFGE